ncbi:MAG: 16S rRNA (cytidine(1402)-2'-O)-methyltransferase [Bacillota bacterium]
MDGKSRKKAGKREGGILYFCATPIGNLQDITLRVLDCLKTVDYIAVENAGHSRKLLNHYGIRAPLLSYREADREKKEQRLLQLLQQGARIALLSDAGMPAISDPGRSLAHQLREHGIPFTVLPGPSAALAALLLSGYPTRRFVFWGFLSRRKKERYRELAQVAHECKTGIIYESPHRLAATLGEMAALLPERELAVCRELTKQFEEVLHGTAQSLQDHFTRVKPRGEITIVVSPLCEKTEQGKNPADVSERGIQEQVQEKLKEALQQGIPPSEAVKGVARAFSLSRRDVYILLLDLQGRKSLKKPPVGS